MKFAEAELRQITEETWRIVLGEELELSPQAMSPADLGDAIAACTQVAGNWQLAVVLYCSASLARRSAAMMFGKEQNAITAEDTNDTLCELVNIIGGNIKGLLSGSSHLSLPSLVKGQDFRLMFPRHILLSEAAFTYEGEHLLVMLLGEDKLAERPASKLANDRLPN